MSKRVTANLILFFVSTLCILSFLEIGTRLFVVRKRPQLIVKRASPAETRKEFSFLKPSFEATLLSAEYEIEIKTNSEGFRDAEFSVNKPGGVFRILVAGDSFTYGIGVEADETYPKIMERILNERILDQDLKYEVFNLGIPDIGTLEELEIIRYGMKYEPDLILLGLLVENRWAERGNDLCDNFRYWDRLKRKKLPKAYPPRDSGVKAKMIRSLDSLHRLLINHSEFYFLLMTRKGGSLRKHLVRLRESQNQERLNSAWEITREALKKIRAIAQEKNLPLVVLFIPFSNDLGIPDPGLRDELVKLDRESGVNLFDLSEALRRNKDENLYYQADGHWRPLGHRLSAEAAVDYLVANNFVPDE